MRYLQFGLRNPLVICIVHGIDYLLTWNCTHIANAMYQPVIFDVCDSYGYAMPVICTPDQLMVTTMNPDPIISEIWRIREEYSRQFDGDLRAMMDDLRRRHDEFGRKSATRQPKLRRRAPVNAGATD